MGGFEMKKNFFIIIALLLVFSVSIRASAVITHEGSYENNDIKLLVIYNWGNSTPTRTTPSRDFSTLRLFIESKKGHDLYNRTRFYYEGRDYIFSAGDVKNGFYRIAGRDIDTKLLRDKTEITLVYEIKSSRDGEDVRTRLVTKHLRIILPPDITVNNAKLKIVELNK